MDKKDSSFDRWMSDIEHDLKILAGFVKAVMNTPVESKPQRNRVITNDDVMNLVIDLNTTEDVTQFLARS